MKGRTQDSGLSLPTRMVIRDESEALFFLTSKTGALLPTQDNICLWTNCRSLVQSFSAMFEDLWHNSIDIQKRMREIETGELISRTCIIDEVGVARRKYLETVQSAKHELLIMTSSYGLVGAWKKLPLAALAEKGVGAKIMAPITSDNLAIARDISKYASVRHVSPNYLETTIVDGKHLFQTNQELFEGSSASDKFSENTIYTSDPEHVKRTRNMLNILWENARVPPILSLECVPSIDGASLPVSDEEYSFSKQFSPYRKMTTFVDENPRLKPEEVLSKIISARKYPAENWPKDIIIQYGSGASAVIHPPKEFGLPNMMFFVQHFNKSSSCGAEDCLLVYTFDGQKYSPAAFVSDNSKGVEIRDSTFAGTHIEGNMQLVKKDQLRVQIHGNTVFAGWSVAIPLHPGESSIPPSCLLIEGYGQLKSGEIRFRLPLSGVERTVEYNGYEAFVTFYHPISRYVGPGTDGIVSRELIQTTYPPSFKE